MAGGPPRIHRLGFSRTERLRFLAAGMEPYRGDPNFVPELRSDLLKRTDPERNPFFRHAEVDHLVVERDGRDVGRVAAIRNLESERFRGDRTGGFGWFECGNDPEAARALLDAAKERLRARGCDALVGPVSYSTNDTCGTLVEGFDGPPVLLMPYNPPWHEALLLGAGLAPAEDLLAWRITAEAVRRDRVARLVARARERHGWTIRPLRMDRFAEELDAVREVYNRAWEANWGFVPMTPEEFRAQAEDLRPLVVPDLVLLAEREGRPVGFALSLPDYNEVLRHMGGSLFPFGWWHFLRGRRRIRGLRTLALGVVPEARNHGLDAGLYLETIERGTALGYTGAECSWTLARNDGINRPLESLGGVAYRRYRLFQGAIEGGGGP